MSIDEGRSVVIGEKIMVYFLISNIFVLMLRTVMTYFASS